MMHVHSLFSATVLSCLSVVSFAASIDAVKRADLAVTAALPANWGYVGCFNDSVYTRDLHPGFIFDDAMTQEKCMSYCISNGYTFAGVEYGKECYCGYRIRSFGGAIGVKQAESQCNMPCAGDTKEKCGGSQLINIFASNQPPPVVNPGVNGFKSVGCKYDAGGNYRTLTTPMTVPGGPDTMTVAKCVAACAASNFIYAGVEYGRECYCGNRLTQGDDTETPLSADNCEIPCKGNSSEWCGGPNNLNMYKSTSAAPGNPSQIPSDWYYQNCYTDDTKTRTLEKLIDLPTNTMTVETCINACRNRNYMYAGLEYGQECWCGNTIGGLGAETYDGCNMNCRGNPSEMCGGPARLSMYHRANPNAQNIAGNPGFEEGSGNSGTYWATQYSYEGVSNLVAGYEENSVHALAGSVGSRNGYIGSSGISTAQTRGMCFVQTFSPMAVGYYNVTVFYGRAHTPSGGANGEVYDDIRMETGFGYYNPAAIPLCSPPSSCTYKVKSGDPNAGYEKVTYFLPGGGQTRQFAICAHYHGTPRVNEDRMIIDQVSVIGPL